MIMRILFLLLLPLTLYAAQPTYPKDTFTTGTISFPAGETITPQFKVPDLNVGIYRLSMPCTPTLNVILTVETSGGLQLLRFTRTPAPCAGSDIHQNVYLPNPIPKGTLIQARFTTDQPITTEITVEVFKSS